MKVWLKTVAFIFLLGLILAIGILLGHFAIPKKSQPTWATKLSQDIDEALIKEFIKEIDNKNIEENLRELTKQPHMATTPGDEELVQLLLKRWKDPKTGLDEAKKDTYDVFLSFPDATNPNNVSIVSTTNKVQFTTLRTEKNYTADQLDPEVVQPYAAYAPPGNPKGKLVYANQGKLSDYEHLRNQSVNLNGSIAIVRYGGAGRAEKVVNAAKFGVIGVVVYTDPKDINDGKTSDKTETYPHSWYLPPSGVERGSYNGYFGDLLTPYYPAKDFTYRMNEAQIQGIPPIPTQPIGFGDAQTLICELGGLDAPSDWQGALSCTYKLGAGFKNGSQFENSDVQVNVYNKRVIKKSDNVMGLIRGSVEPDRYVIYGNHRDSWVHGAIDPSSGTAVMLEMSRVLGKMVKEGKWRPRRSIIFGSWGAEEFGLIGSTEYTEEYHSKLRDRTVAYINVDIAVFANATLRALGVPPLQNVIFTAAKQVLIPGSTSVSVYNNWIQYFNRTSPSHGRIPSIGSLGAGSDYAPFIHYLGIPSVDIAYTYDRSKTGARIYPAYHTAYDTFDYASRFIDPGFTAHQTVARTAGNVLLQLADSLIIPFNISDYAESLEQLYKTAEDNLKGQLNAKNISIDPLKNAVGKFRDAASNLDQVIATLKNTNEIPLKIRMINDQLLLLERAFLDPLAFPDKYYYRHVIFASKESGIATFPGLADTFTKASSSDLEKDWDEVRKHLTILVRAMEGAAHTLDVSV
ncbi:aminopeptidase NAALADL1 [Latimeria chalumnae]|uniref:Aminopeptidase NAALADL1 n=1 Tax=Latimeria chalumnae TaxID=7897 RepID=H3BEY4_LATCH|nr:PREDICTED: N-acetylated-alpha-linked acidic dipeptidase-like protein [Latimeria chalumnae]|eukprot:XP_005988971.1 PREDICTED: N-acetylated-alpha-linked acidic dipeptidase-like protein [Latimeria chalumnae]